MNHIPYRNGDPFSWRKEAAMDSKAGSLAKVIPPTLHNCSDRTRLFRLLDEKRYIPAMWIAGPPGSGKTTLVRSYIDHLGLPCLWYQMDAGDTDPASFFYYLGLAARKAVPKLRKPFPLLTPEYLPGLSVFAIRFFETLYDRLELPAVLVFDNYQEVTSQAPIHRLLRHGLEHLPEGVRVFLVSRTHPPPAMTRLRANGRMGLVQWEDLRLTLAEAGDIVSLRHKGKMTHQDLRALYDQTGGWAAGLSLLLESVRSPARAMQAVNPEGMADVFDYFAGEVFENSPQELQALLLKTSFLPEFSQEMARLTTGNPHSRTLLQTLCRKNYFITRHLHRKMLYRYHPLFREFLISRAQETLSNADLTELHRISAGILEKEGKIGDAANLWLKAANYNAVVHIIMQNARALLGQGRFHMVDTWLRRLPRNLVETNPWLLLFKSLCRLPVDPHKAEQLAGNAYHGFKEQGDVAGMLLAWTAVIDAIEYALGGCRAMDDWIAEFESIKEAYTSLPGKEIKARVSTCMFEALTFRRPQHIAILDWASSAMSLWDELGDINEQIKIRALIVWYHISYTGDVIQAECLVNEMLQLAGKGTAAPLASIMAYWAEGVYHQYSANMQKAIAAGVRGLELSRKTGVTFLECSLHGLIAESHLNAGRTKDAAERIQLLEQNLGTSNLWLQFMLNQTNVRMLLQQKKLHQAEALLGQASELSKPLGIWFCNPIINLQKAQLSFLKGNHSAALYHIRCALKDSAESQSFHHQAQFLFEKAHIDLELGNERAGLASLREALHIARQLGLMFCFWDLPEVTTRLCIRAMEEDIEADYAREIIRRRRITPEHPPVHLETWPWAVKISTLGAFAAHCDDKLVRFGRKTPQKPLELLKLAIALGGNQVHEARIIDALWPDADGDSAHQSLKTTLHRLRKLIGHPEAFKKKGNRISLDRRRIWTDLWAFEALHASITTAGNKPSGDRGHQGWMRGCEKAISLYQGNFLTDEVWAPELIAKREQVRGWFIYIVEALGRHLEATGQWERAADLYEKAIEKEESRETFYGRLMHSYHRLNRHGEALATYERCKSVLAAVLGTAPSPKIKKMYQSLKF
jgi:LuxR family maltose regulon positive regulatory protein